MATSVKVPNCEPSCWIGAGDEVAAELGQVVGAVVGAEAQVDAAHVHQAVAVEIDVVHVGRAGLEAADRHPLGGDRWWDSRWR